MKKILTLLMLVLMINVVQAQEQIVVNSARWQDVYSGQLYAAFNADDSYFLTSKEYSTFVSKVLTDDPVTVIQSSKAGHVANLDNSLFNKGYDVKETIEGENLNLILAKKLNKRNLIVVDSAYGYDAISVAPYALKTDSYVLLSNKENQQEIRSYIDEVEPSKLILYGDISKSLRDSLQDFNPEIINKGGKFLNNVEIAQKFLIEEETKQATFTNGKFLEAGLFNKEYPNIFLGSQVTPDETKDFIKSNIQTAVVVGNDLISEAREIKNQAQLRSVLVKYAQGVPSQNAFAPVVALDMFPVPEPEMEVVISELSYNTAAKTLELKIQNIGDRAYLLSSITILEDEVVETVGDSTPLFIEKGQTVSVAYKVDLTDFIARGAQLKASALIRLGPEEKSLEYSLSQDFGSIPTTQITDNARVELVDVEYNTKLKELAVTVENSGDVDAYVKSEVIATLLNVYGEEEDISFENNNPKLVAQGAKEDIILKAVLDTSTITKAKVNLAYGSRSDILINTITIEDIDLNSTSGVKILGIIAIIIVFIILALAIIVIMNRK